MNMNPSDIHNLFAALGIKEATIHNVEGDFYYLSTEPTEYVFHQEGTKEATYSTPALPEGKFHLEALNAGLKNLGITELTIHSEDGDFYYLKSNDLIQFGLEGHAPHEYAVVPA